MTEQSDIDPWQISHCGGKYEILYDVDREYLQPKWWVKRLNDQRASSRYYTFSGGAFIALSTGSIVWT